MANAQDKGMVDLGKPMPSGGLQDDESEDGKMSYPTLYIRDIPELDDLPDGEFYFTAKGKVTQHTESDPVDGEDDGHCSCEITVLSMKPMASGKKAPKSDPEAGLDGALDSIAQKKADDAEDSQDDGNDEDTEST